MSSKVPYSRRNANFRNDHLATQVIAMKNAHQNTINLLRTIIIAVGIGAFIKCMINLSIDVIEIIKMTIIRQGKIHLLGQDLFQILTLAETINNN